MVAVSEPFIQLIQPTIDPIIERYADRSDWRWQDFVLDLQSYVGSGLGKPVERQAERTGMVVENFSVDPGGRGSILMPFSSAHRRDLPRQDLNGGSFLALIVGSK